MGYFDSQIPDQPTSDGSNRYFGSGVNSALSSPDQAPVPQEIQDALTKREFNLSTGSNVGWSPVGKIAGFLAGTGVDLADTAVSSFGLLAKRGDIWHMFDGTSLGDYYKQNRNLIEGSSAIVGTLATGAVASEFLLPKLATALASSTALTSTRLWQAGTEINAATRANMLTEQAKLASEGKTFSMLGTAAGRQYLGLETLKGAAAGLGQEAFMYATLNSNRALYTNDVANNLFWAATGVGIGAAVGGLAARAMARRIANSDVIKSIRAASLDPAGVSNIFVHPDSADFTVNSAQKVNESTNVTSLTLMSRAATPEGAPEGIVSRMHSLRDRAEALAMDGHQKMNVAGIEGVTTVKGKVGEIPEYKALAQDMKSDPMILFGADSVGIPSKGIQGGHNQHIEQIQNLREQADVLEGKRANPEEAAKLRQRANLLANQEEVAYIDHRFVNATDENAYAVGAYDPAKAEIKVEPMRGSQTFSAGYTFGGQPFFLNQAFTLNRDFAALQMGHKLTVIDAMNQLLNGMLKRKIVHVVTQKNDWFALEAASEYARRAAASPEGLTNLVDFYSKAGFKSMEELRLHSLQLRAKAFLSKFGDGQPITEWDRMAYNLPKGTAFERIHDPTGTNLKEWLNMVLAADPKQSALLTLSQLEEARQATLALHGFDVMPSKLETNTIENIHGNMFQFNRDSKGNWLRPMLAYFNTESGVKPISPQGLAEAQAGHRAMVLNALMSGPKDGLTYLLAEAVMSMPETQKAMDMLGMANDQVTGLSNPVGQLAGEFLTTRFKARDASTIMAATNVQALTARLVNARIEQLMTDYGMTDALSELNSASNRGTSALVNQFFSNRAGWDLEKEPIPMSRDMVGFKLADSEKNRSMLGLPKGEAVPEDAFLTNDRTGKPIVLDQKGLSIVTRYNAVTDAVLSDVNAIRMARGLTPIERMHWYTPVPPLKNKWVAFTMNEFDQPVRGAAIIADSEKEMLATKARMLDEFRKEGNTSWYIQTKNELDNLRQVWDKSAMDWMDPGFAGRRKYQQTGTLSGQYVNPNAFADALAWVKNQVMNTGHDTIQAIFANQLQIARMHASVERAVTGAPKVLAKEQRTIWDEYQAALTGRRQYADPTSMSGQLFTGAEDRINRILRNVPNASLWLHDLATRMNVPIDRFNNARNFEDISKALGPYTPYANLKDYMDQTLKVRPPIELRKITEKTNWLAATLLLRYLELPQAALNMAGIISTMPALMRAGQSPITVGFELADHSRIGFVDSMKMMANGFADMWRNDAKTMRHWDAMVKNGDATQPVADFNRQMASVTSHAGFRKVMFGTGNVKRDGFVKGRGIDGLLGVATDMSENWSRQWAHFIGLRMAEAHGITDFTSMHDFAREIANAAIADYAPVNRPELFQSATGSMIGLFMTYMMNQNMKMFRWMENKQFAALGTQVALQASLFGMTGVPGVQQLMSFHDWFTGSTGKNEPTALDWLYARFGPLVGNAIAHGGLATLPFAFYTRGDQTIRLPTGGIQNFAAGPRMMTNIAKSIVDAVGVSLSGYSPDKARQVAEILSRDMPNRILKGWMEVGLLGGDSIDSHGNIVAQTRTWADTAARLVGLRSTRQQAEINAYYAGRSTMQAAANRMDSVRNSMKADIRKYGGGTNALNNIDVNKYFNLYVKAGGSPNYFRSWLINLMQEANSSRGMNDLKNSLSNPSNYLQAWRYGAYGAY